MLISSSRSKLKNAVTLGIAFAVGIGAGMASLVGAAPVGAPSVPKSAAPPEFTTDPGNMHHLDRSGSKQFGKASFYADRYAGKKMADGSPLQLYGNNAASLTLPLGTRAEVKNLETGKSAIITIRDRGPYVAGRIVDLSPATARLIGISRKQGLARVEVTPISLPHSPS